MPRVKRINRPVEKKISLPEDLVAQVDLHLYSELEEKVPFGSWSALVETLLRGHLAQVKQG